jgi:hypothetical protein
LTSPLRNGVTNATVRPANCSPLVLIHWFSQLSGLPWAGAPGFQQHGTRRCQSYSIILSDAKKNRSNFLTPNQYGGFDGE